MKKDIHREILIIKARLGYAEDTDHKYMSLPVRELRHCVMYVHSALESAMDLRIGQYLTNHMKSTRGEFQDFNLKMRDVTNEMDFAKKAKILHAWGFIPNLYGKLMAVNQVRIEFSHPSTYVEKLRSYRKEEDALKVFQILEKAHNGLNSLIISEHPEWETS